MTHVREVELETKDGQKIIGKIYHIEGDPSEAQKNLALAGRLTGEWAQKAIEEEMSSTSFANYYREGNVVRPPVPLKYYTELARRDPIHRACIEAKVANICLQGYRIRARAELATSQESEAMASGGTEETDNPQSQRRKEKISEFLKSALPDYTFSELLACMWRDVETCGNGYLEILRGGDGVPDGLWPVKAETIRILKGEEGYMQIRDGGGKAFFAKYTADPERRVARVKVQRESKSGGKGIRKKSLLNIIGWGGKYPADEFVGMADLDLLSEGQEAAVVLTELLAIKKGTPKDSYYGEPDILVGIDDYIGALNARQFNISYFDNATIPRMAIIVRGGYFAESVVEEIKNFVKNQNRVDALSQVLLLQLETSAGEADIQIQPLSVAQLKDAGFLEYRQSCDEHIMKAHRVPQSILEVAGETSNEANQRFLINVVRPAQRIIESRFNYIFEKEFGATEWVLDLNVPDLLTERQRAEIWDILLRRGVLTINEVRRTLGFAPVNGGDVPFVLVPGQGGFPIAFMDRIVEMGPRALEAVRGSGSRTKTPPKGVGTPTLPDGEGEGKAIAVPDKSFKYLDSDVAEMMAAVAEEITINPDDLVKSFRPPDDEWEF